MVDKVKLVLSSAAFVLTAALGTSALAIIAYEDYTHGYDVELLVVK